MRRRTSRSHFRRLSVALVVTSVCVLSTALPAGAALIKLPKAGTAAQVSALVAASTKIHRVPTDLYPQLSKASEDFLSFTTYDTPFPGGCLSIGAPHCTFGDTKSKKIVVLFGDSHAWMWLAAVNPLVKQDGYKLELLWRASCPAATLTLYNDEEDPNHYDTPCNVWRSSMISAVVRQHPALVLLGERTSDIFTAPGTLVTNAALATGLKTTIKDLKAPSTKVAVIGDIPAFAKMEDPLNCLTLHTTNVQLCDTPLVSTQAGWITLAPGEETATKAEGATYINAAKWMCHSGECSPIIGNMPTYVDWTHVTATYSAYLATVMGTAIKPLL